MKYLIAIIFLAGATAVNAQQYTITGPDYFGNRSIRGANGFNGTINAPDYFGNQSFRYNNGTSGTLSAPDYFGNRTLRYNQPMTMPRYNSFGRW